MGRELQKKKNRSGLQKIRQKPKSKKRLLTNPIIAANWDKTQTLAQNYKRLGLTSKLNKNTGGVERKVSDVLREAEGETNQNRNDGLSIAGTNKRRQKLDVSEAKIERDITTGRILRVVEEPKLNSNPLNDPLNDLDSESDDEVYNLRNQHGNTAPSAAVREGKTETVQQLEARANLPAKKYKRRQPEGEIKFIEELVRTYGDDLEKMARDMKINYMQRSEGDLRKRISKWKESGGNGGLKWMEEWLDR